MTRTAERLCAVFGAACCAVVALGALTISAPSAPPAAAANGPWEREVFDQLAADEPAAREQTLEDWAHHPWSQQDAFSATERENAANLARAKNLSLQDAFRALDDGMRAGWTTADGGTLRTTITPLRPRPMD